MAIYPTNASPPAPDDEINALTELLRRINSPDDTVLLSRSDRIRISYGLRLLRLEITGQVCDTSTGTIVEQADERGRK